jgi:hypothetical protein
LPKKKTATTAINGPMSDDKWKARDDARTLASAKEIAADASRHKKAVSMGKELLAEKLAEIQSLRKVCHKKI